MFFVDPELPAPKQRQAYGRILEDFSSLMKHPAWEQITKYLEDEEARLIQSMADISQADTALRAAVALGTIRRIRQLPLKAAETASEALKQLQ